MAEDRLKEAKTFFTEGNKTSDAIIQVEDHELHVDLVVISLMSSTLASEFQPRPDQNSPPGETNKAVAKLVGPVDHTVDMLTSIYPNFRNLNVVDKNNVEYLLPLATKYNLLFLQQACESVIVELVPKMESSARAINIQSQVIWVKEEKERLMRYFLLADKNKLAGTRTTCMERLVKCQYSGESYQWVATRNTEAFQQLAPSTRWEILRNRVFYLEGNYGKVTDNAEDL